MGQMIKACLGPLSSVYDQAEADTRQDLRITTVIELSGLIIQRFSQNPVKSSFN